MTHVWNFSSDNRKKCSKTNKIWWGLSLYDGDEKRVAKWKIVLHKYERMCYMKIKKKIFRASEYNLFPKWKLKKKNLSIFFVLVIVI